MTDLGTWPGVRPGGPDVRPGGPGDAAAIGALIADAFFELPPAEWLIPERDLRRAAFPRYFLIFAEYALTHGTVYLGTGPGGEVAAAALWLPMTEPLPPPESYPQRLADVCAPWLERFQLFDETLEANHPDGEQHHHLAFLAVTPQLQGRGIGSRLLTDHHALLDGMGMPAYLEASDPRSRELYLRHGYRPLGEPFHLPDGPPFYPMWRPPRVG